MHIYVYRLGSNLIRVNKEIIFSIVERKFKGVNYFIGDVKFVSSQVIQLTSRPTSHNLSHK
jgi:hypothetical protein